MSISIIGDTYGRLTVLELHSNIKYRKKFICKCSCGNTTIVAMTHLRTGHTQSCGCLLEEALDQTTHGYSKTKLYKVYYEMLYRCHNPKSDGYKKYGAKGITVCTAWQEDFLAFKQWATDYKEGLTIDRINNKLGYSPDNCRWVSHSVQAINKGKSILNTSGYKYINWHKGKEKWIVRITVNSERIEIGAYLDIEKAKTELVSYLTINKLHEHLKAFNYG